MEFLQQTLDLLQMFLVGVLALIIIVIVVLIVSPGNNDLSLGKTVPDENGNPEFIANKRGIRRLAAIIAPYLRNHHW